MHYDVLVALIAFIPINMRHLIHFAISVAINLQFKSEREISLRCSVHRACKSNFKSVLPLTILELVVSHLIGSIFDASGEGFASRLF